MDALENRIRLLTVAYSLIIIGLVFFVLPLFAWCRGKKDTYSPSMGAWCIAGIGTLLLGLMEQNYTSLIVWAINIPFLLNTRRNLRLRQQGRDKPAEKEPPTTPKGESDL